MSTNDYAWVLRGSQRKRVLMVMDKEKIPSQLSKETKLSLNNTSDTLRLMKEKGIVKCLNEKDKTGRLYVVTKKGKAVRDKILGKH